MALPTSRDISDPTDPRSMTPEQRQDELCALLAIGARRVMALRAGPGGSALDPALSDPETALPLTPPVCAPDGLELSGQKSVHVPRG